MNSKKVYYSLIGVLALVTAIVLVGVFIGNANLEKGSHKLVRLKLDNKILDEQQIALVRANKDIAKYSDLEKIAKTIVPQDKDQAKVVREIIGLANDAGIPIQFISFPTSNLGQAKTSVVTPGASSSTKVITPPSQLKTVVGSTGLYQLEITVQSDTARPVTYPQLIDFLSKLEQNRRTAQVTSITVTPSSRSRKLITFSLIVTVYIKP